MKAMFVAFAAIIVISAVAGVALDYAGFSSAERASGANVRLD